MRARSTPIRLPWRASMSSLPGGGREQGRRRVAGRLEGEDWPPSVPDARSIGRPRSGPARGGAGERRGRGEAQRAGRGIASARRATLAGLQHGGPAEVAAAQPGAQAVEPDGAVHDGEFARGLRQQRCPPRRARWPPRSPGSPASPRGPGPRAVPAIADRAAAAAARRPEPVPKGGAGRHRSRARAGRRRAADPAERSKDCAVSRPGSPATRAISAKEPSPSQAACPGDAEQLGQPGRARVAQGERPGPSQARELAGSRVQDRLGRDAQVAEIGGQADRDHVGWSGERRPCVQRQAEEQRRGGVRAGRAGRGAAARAGSRPRRPRRACHRRSGRPGSACRRGPPARRRRRTAASAASRAPARRRDRA